MITLKEYAEKKHVSYEVIRREVNKYRKELGEHLYKENRTQYLDSEAEAFLDMKRNEINQKELHKDVQIKKLKAENAELKEQILELQKELLEEKRRKKKKWWQVF